MEQELYHHGILGQKWGVRRYQNPDGTLTAAGKRRLSKSVSKEVDKTNSKIAKNEWFESYNRMTNKMNSGLIDQFNEKNPESFDEAVDAYDDLTERVRLIELNKRRYEEYGASEAKKIIDEFGMNNWDNLSKEFYKNYNDLKETIDDQIEELEKMGYKY